MVIIWVKDLTGYQTKNTGNMICNTLDLLLRYETFADFKHLDVKIYAVTVIRADDTSIAHWSLFFHTDTSHLIKVELQPQGHKVIYGAVFPEVTGYMVVEKFLLPWLRTVRDIFSYICELSIEFGPWSLDQDIPKPYGCKDFVVDLLKNFGVPYRDILPYELRKTVSRRCPPLVYEYDDAYNEVPAKGEPIIYTSRVLICFP